MAKKEIALKYLKLGFSVIPIVANSNKKPCIEWKEFQERLPTEKEIKEWWGKWPNANIALVTGPISKLFVIDIDSIKALEFLHQHFPEDYTTTQVQTPSKNWHFWFKYPENTDVPFGNSASKIFPNFDTRGVGGYIIAPPSKDERGEYKWLVSLKQCLPNKLPNQLFNLLHDYYKHNNNYYYNTSTTYQSSSRVTTSGNTLTTTRRQLTTNDNKIPQGQRDETLFHIANHLVKGRMPVGEIQEILTLIALHGCKPPFDPKEADRKVESALKRAINVERAWMEEVRSLIATTSGNIMTTDVHKWLQATTRSEKKIINVCLLRLEKEGLIKKTGKRAGEYRIVDDRLEKIDYRNVTNESLDLSLPFEADKFFYVKPKNIIVFAGVPDSGKTAIAFNIIKLNQNKPNLPKIHYFSSEMGADEIHSRLKNFDDVAWEDWNFEAYERSEKFEDVIAPDDINIIDFLEIHDNFYKVSEHIFNIFQNLKKGIAIIFLQKHPDSEFGRGGIGSLEKARAYFTVDKDFPVHRLTIKKMKNWRIPNRNPNGLSIEFKIVGGCKLVEAGDWTRRNKKDKNKNWDIPF